MTSAPEGYLAEPDSKNGRAVLVLHAWWGLNETMKSVCTRLADAGFAAFAPDLFRGKVADTIDGAEALMQEFEGEQTGAAVNEAVKYLSARSGKIAVVGFSYGAYYALELSAAEPERIESVVIFYGTGHDEFGTSRAAYLCHFAENDEFEPLENVNHLEESLKRAGRPVTVHIYPGTGHWFFEPDRVDAFNKEAADLAWERTLEFLTQPLTR